MDQKQYEYNAGRVSIVTPVYNGETHLAKMLDSVLAQTYPDVEMILVDDGSADGTVRAAQNYSEKFEAKGMDTGSSGRNIKMRPRRSTKGCPLCRGNI